MSTRPMGASPDAPIPAPNQAPEPAIEVRNLDKTYPGDVHALRGLTFSVPAGSVFALLGPNGAGKSTTVKVLTTLSRPDSGTARVDGCDVLADPQQVRRRIGVVAQQAAVDLEATGTENLVLQGQLYGLRGAGLRNRAAELLDRFGLADAAGRVARTYSGGMQRKLDVAMGLVHQPRVLFLDEPTTGLDPESRAEMWAEIRRLADEGLTVLLTTHYLEEADQLAARVAIVDEGRVVVEGTPDVLKADLRGDAVQLGLRTAHSLDELTRLLAAVDSGPTVSELMVDGTTVRARVDDGAAALPGLLAALDAAGIPVVTAAIARPSLDDVYLRHTGKALRDAGGHERTESTKEVAA